MGATVEVVVGKGVDVGAGVIVGSVVLEGLEIRAGTTESEVLV